MELLMGEAVLLPRILKSFLEWWHTIDLVWLVLLFFIAFIIILLIYYYSSEGGIHYVVTPRVPVSMRKVANPFTFSLDRQSTSFPGVRCTFSSTKFCYILPFWGVPANEFCDVIRMNWSSIKYNLIENVDNTFKTKCVASEPITSLCAGEQKSLVFKPPPSVYLDERMDQNHVLPLVVFMLFMEDLMDDEEPFIFLYAVIIKVPAITISIQERSANREPNFCANLSRIPENLGTYLRESHSHATGVIQVVYDGSMYSENINGVEIPLCVACCQRTVNTVIFPCLHSSLCSICYHRCDSCPSCRGPMYHYFIFGPPTEVPQD